MYSVVFMGTPDFAVPSLQKLSEIGAEIKCVVTQPDKPFGRKQVLTPPAVKQAALEKNYTVYQPSSMKSDEAYEYIKSFEPDFIVVAAYGKILPKRVLDIPKYGCINVHGSLLPKYRGAAPIQWAVINGENETGITTMLMNEGLDTGDILEVVTTKINENETSGELFDRLAFMGADLLVKTLDNIISGNITLVKQDESKATYASMLSKDTALIDWNKTYLEIIHLVNGLNPWPIAFTLFNNKKIKIYKCEKSDKTLSVGGKQPGTLFSDNGKIYAVCSDGILHITELQVEGSKKMSDTAYLNGHTF